MKKNTLILFALLLGSYVVGQEINVYVPLRTYHYDRTPDYEYHSTEGGNLGAVLTYRNTNNKWFRDISAGAIRNSFGNLSFVGQFGVGRHLNKINVSLSLGLITGYSNLFEDGDNQLQNTLPSWMVDNGILPAVNFVVSYNLGRVSPLIIISPEYINIGININIKQ